MAAADLPDNGADTTTERSEGMVEAAGVEPLEGRFCKWLITRGFWQ